MAYDIYWDKVVLGLHMDDTGLTDVKGCAVTLNGNVARSATQSKFGGYSAYFDGTGDYLTLASSADFGLGTGNFTIEFWIRITANGASGGSNILDFRSSVGASPFTLYVKNTGSGNYLGSYTALGSGSMEWAGTFLSLDTWYHVAVVRNAGSWACYLGGTALAFTTGTATGANGDLGSSKPLTIGAAPNGTVAITGYLDDLRITKGVARYLENFTPSTEAFPDRLPAVSGVVRDSTNAYAQRLIRIHDRTNGTLLGQGESNGTTGAYSISVNTDKEVYAVAYAATSYDPYWDKVVLAMHMNEAGLPDLKGKTVSTYGTAARSATQSKFGGYSAYFNGSSSYLVVTHATDFDFGSGDFTVEFFYCPQAPSAYSAIIGFDEGDWPFMVYHGSGLNGGNPFVAIGPSSSAWFANTSNMTLGAVTNGTWYHIAITRSGDTFRVFKDGTQTASGTTDSARQAVGAATTMTLAKNGAYYATCYIDDLRITKGFARYTANFTAPTTAFLEGPTGGTENAVILDRLVPA